MLVSEMITKVRQRANIEASTNIEDSDQFITDAEILSYLNEGGREVHQRLVSGKHDYFLKMVELSPSNAALTLPSDFYQIRGLDYKLNGDWKVVYPYQLAERNQFNNSWSYNTYWQKRVEYKISKTTIDLIPESNANSTTYRLFYDPTFTDLTANDTYDLPNGWELYLVLYAALQCRMKEDIGDTSNLEGMLSRITKEIEAWCSRGQPKHIVNSRKSKW